MIKYNVKLLPRALKELEDIYEYISYNKLAPEAAKEQVHRIRKSILDLAFFPQSHQERIEGRFAGKGYRQLLVNNYIVIFRINESEKTEYVVTIQYYGRNI